MASGRAHFIVEQSESDIVTGLFGITMIPELSNLENTLGVPVITAGPELEFILDSYDEVFEQRLQEFLGAQ
jgi:hypothetical protein